MFEHTVKYEPYIKNNEYLYFYFFLRKLPVSAASPDTSPPINAVNNTNATEDPFKGKTNAIL